MIYEYIVASETAILVFVGIATIVSGGLILGYSNGAQAITKHCVDDRCVVSPSDPSSLTITSDGNGTSSITVTYDGNGTSSITVTSDQSERVVCINDQPCITSSNSSADQEFEIDEQYDDDF
jgi:hypothetical protein